MPLKSSQKKDKYLFLSVKVYWLIRFFYKIKGLF
jgi:hypothetical protein